MFLQIGCLGSSDPSQRFEKLTWVDIYIYIYIYIYIVLK